MTEPTAGELTVGIAGALRAGDLDAVGELLKALAAADLHQAQLVYDVLQFGVVVAPFPQDAAALAAVLKDGRP